MGVCAFEFEFGGPAEAPDVFDGGEKMVVRDFPEAGLFLSQRKPELKAEVFQQFPACIERAGEQGQFAFGVKRAFEPQAINRYDFELDEVNSNRPFGFDPFADSQRLLDGIPWFAGRLVIMVGECVGQSDSRA